MTAEIRGQAAIVGIGATDCMVASPYSAIQMAGWALKAALDDAGLVREDIDGYVSHTGNPMGVDYDHLVPALGLNVRNVAQYWSHGRWVTSALQHAALVVIAGLADVVAVVTPIKMHGWTPPSATENKRESGGPHGQALAFGMTGAHAGAALAVRKYYERYGIEGDALLPVVSAAHAHAARNPRALTKEPLDPEKYLAQPYLMDPLRPLDSLLYNDAAVVVLVTTAERAKSCKKPPIYLLGMQGMRAGRDEAMFAPRNLGIQQQPVEGGAPEPHPREVYDMAGVSPADIDALYAYDVYSPQILFTLERFGHCAPGTAARFAAEGHTAPGGRLPVNTSGGMLAEGYCCGWHSIAEAVRQLRGEAGPTQLPRARLLQWATTAGDSVIFGNEA